MLHLIGLQKDAFLHREIADMRNAFEHHTIKSFIVTCEAFERHVDVLLISTQPRCLDNTPNGGVGSGLDGMDMSGRM